VQRLLAYMIAGLASFLGWKLGALMGMIPAFFAAMLSAAAALYLARRWLREVLG
jgi:hypothetical protein